MSSTRPVRPFKLTPAKARRINASMRDQRLDVNLRIMSPQDYIQMVNGARELGVVIADDVEAFVAQIIDAQKGTK